MPNVLQLQREKKHAKLLQYAERVWNIRSGSDEERIDAAIAATRAFFEQMGVKTRLSDYGLDGSSIPALLDKLQAHQMTALGGTWRHHAGAEPSDLPGGALSEYAKRNGPAIAGPFFFSLDLSRLVADILHRDA
ncbi:Alcohol dehydrogenase YqhD [Edwardsiella tarda]|nr:Alcohol dehydrogenase YqhD [Edwardsiella tarda]